VHTNESLQHAKLLNKQVYFYGLLENMSAVWW